MKTINISETLAQVGKTFKVLNERERQILRARHGLEDGKICTLDEISKKYRITRERVRQIEAKAIEKMELVIQYDQE